MELNREQIIKALECCHTKAKDCLDCPYENDHSSCIYLEKNALSLIKELAEENERLQKHNAVLIEDNHILSSECIPKAKSDTVWKYHDKVEELINCADDVNPVSYWQNDQIAKEMLEGKD